MPKIHPDPTSVVCWTMEDIANRQDCKATEKTPQGWVYVLAAHDVPHVKIGYTAKLPKEREREVQQGASLVLRMMACFRGNRTDEQELHERFAEYRVRGEWFHRNDDIDCWLTELIEEELTPWHEQLPGPFLFLCRHQPTLMDIFNDILMEHPTNEKFCANACWYGYGGCVGYRDRLYSLIGWHAKTDDRRLKTSEAWDTAYQTLYAALPGCRNCGCVSLEGFIEEQD